MHSRNPCPQGMASVKWLCRERFVASDYSELKCDTFENKNHLNRRHPDRFRLGLEKSLWNWLDGIIYTERCSMDPQTFAVRPIGRVRKEDGRVWIDIEDVYREAMLGLSGFSHIHVLYWFHENDNRQSRSMMQVRPRRDPKNPLTGVFATHSPHRPNLIALTLCRIVRIDDLTIEIEKIDARDNSPVIDIKCYIPYSTDPGEFRVPDWV